MKFAWLFVFIFFYQCCVTKGDEVEELLKLIKRLEADITNGITGAKAEKDKLVKRKMNVYKKSRGSIHSLMRTRNAENDAINKKRKEYEAQTSGANITKGLEPLAETLAKQKVKEFDVKLQGYKDFISDKQNQLNELLAVVRNGYNRLRGIEGWVEVSKQKLANATLGDADVTRLQRELHLISRQVQLQQFNEEEKVRSDGNSGIKQIRTRNVGAKNYFSNTHSGGSFAAIHDHSNNIRTVGMGEFIAVLNGVEFRTRHNDYRLKQAVEKDKTFGKTRDIEFPEVPPEVKNKGTVDEQVKEMVAWFKAFKEQNHKTRDYRQYFKPILCYLEGAWTTSNGDNIDEPFESDRHHIDASGWFDLQEKIRFTSYSGTKSKLENLAHLPTTIMDFTDDEAKKPIFAQWNYRILCHPLKNNLPTKYLKLVLDPASQKMTNRDDAQYASSRAAKFDVEGLDVNGKRTGRPLSYTLLDSLMEEIPGKDNYGAWISANGFDSEILSAHPKRTGNKLNGANYHRPYKLKTKDAMGVDSAQRGYSDRLYVALTTQPRISGPSYTKEVTENGKKVKKIVKVKASFAIPMEIIYLTPLSKWNPYDLIHKDGNSDILGKGTVEEPFSNTVPKTYFRTPHKFFSGVGSKEDPADTAQAGGVYISQPGKNEPVAVHASGTRILFPEIAGITGRIRQRYPIMPIYGEGSSVWKKLNALEDSIDFESVGASTTLYFSTGISHVKPEVQSIHTHIINLDKQDVDKLKTGKVSEIEASTETANGHFHKITIKYESEKLVIKTCEKQAAVNDKVCFDQHSNELHTSSPE